MSESLTEFLLARIAEDERTIPCEWNCHERVHRECAAKRRIVEVHAHNARWDDTNMGDWARATLELLALPYADHPDYREEWKP